MTPEEERRARHRAMADQLVADVHAKLEGCLIGGVNDSPGDVLARVAATVEGVLGVPVDAWYEDESQKVVCWRARLGGEDGEL